MVYGPIAAMLVELSRQNSLQCDVSPVSHRQRLVRRLSTDDRVCDGGGDGRYYYRTLVSDCIAGATLIIGLFFCRKPSGEASTLTSNRRAPLSPF